MVIRMAIQRRDVLEGARRIVTAYGLADLTMRRLATELGVQPSAIYWHVPNKQALLAELADDLLASVPAPSPRRRWDRQLTQLANELRGVLLSHPDAAEIVSSSHASELGTSTIGKRIVEIVESGGHPRAHALASRDALLHFVIGFCLDEQSHSQMASLGAAPARVVDSEETFAAALAVLVCGIRGGA